MPELTDRSVRLSLPFILPSQAQKHVTHNEALTQLDMMVQLVLTERGAEVPPAVPVPGQIFGLGANPQSEWAGQAGQLAVWDGTTWTFLAAQEGWQAYDQATAHQIVFDGGTWQNATRDLANIDGVGIGTGWDGINRLSVASAATLFSHEGLGGHQLKINKASAADTASLLFQSAWTGHAEMGLSGDTAFSIKISADGGTWYEALKMDPDSGETIFAPDGVLRASLTATSLNLDVPLTGTAVQQSPMDTTTGRLLQIHDGAGAFGLGGAGLAITDYSTIAGCSHFIAGGGSAVTADAPPDGAVYRPGVVMHRSSSDRSSVLHFTNTGAVVRNYTGGVPDADWNLLFGQQNILGTVSQTGGIPTGAIIEQGSTSNGEYVRFADGTQECRTTLVALPGSGVVWTFPVMFSEAPVVTGNAVAAVLSCVVLDLDPLPTSCTVSARGANDARRPDTLHLVARGRWF